jgi:hypothetical protein
MAILGQGVLGNVLSAAGTAAKGVASITPENSLLHVAAYQLGKEHGVSEALNSGGASAPQQQTTPGGSVLLSTGGNNGTAETQANTNTSLASGGANYGAANAYDQQIQTLLNAANSLQGQKSTQETLANGQFNQSNSRLDTSYGQSKDNLNYQKGAIKSNKAQSLNDLANSGRNALQAFSNQLGALGAGSSSAVGLGQYALARQQARSGLDLNRQYNDQQHSVDVASQQLETGYQQSKQDLEQQKQSKLFEIAQSYKTIADQINSQMMTANEARRQALGGINQQAASEVAAQVAALEAQYNTAMQGLQQKYGSIQYTPNTAAVTNTDQYAKFVNDPAIDATLSPDQQQQQINTVYSGAYDPNKDQQPLYLA